MNRVSAKLSALFITLALAVGIAPALAWASNPTLDTDASFMAGTVFTQEDEEPTVETDLTSIASIELSFSSCYYDGTEKSPDVVVRTADSVLAEGIDYELAVPTGRIAAGTYTYTVNGAGDYTGSLSATLTINKTALSQCTFGKISKQVFTGKAIKPGVKATFQGNVLKKGTDYKLSYSKNKNHGTAKVKVTGIGSCKGTKELKFTISPANVSKTKISKVKSKTYSGEAQTQKPVIKLGKLKLKKGRDYTLSYKRNVNAGKATMIVKGKGNFKGKTTKKFRINRASITKAWPEVIGTQTLTGSAVWPAPNVWFKGKLLKRGRDYKLSWSNNYCAGTGSVKIIGKGNFRGSMRRSFSIVKPVLENVFITRTGECFHRDGCGSLSRSRIPISRSDAIARGFRPCRNCRP